MYMSVFLTFTQTQMWHARTELWSRKALNSLWGLLLNTQTHSYHLTIYFMDVKSQSCCINTYFNELTIILEIIDSEGAEKKKNKKEENGISLYRMQKHIKMKCILDWTWLAFAENTWDQLCLLHLCCMCTASTPWNTWSCFWFHQTGQRNPWTST